MIFPVLFSILDVSSIRSASSASLRPEMSGIVLQKKRSARRDLSSEIDLWATLWATSSETRRPTGTNTNAPFLGPAVAHCAVPAQNQALQSTLIGVRYQQPFLPMATATSPNATASRTPVIFSHDVIAVIVIAAGLLIHFYFARPNTDPLGLVDVGWGALMIEAGSNPAAPRRVQSTYK